jgi:DNA repair protein RadA/Sms
MAKAKSVYSCTECGGQVLKWQGQCPHCQAWNTLVEALAEAAPAGANRYSRIAEAGKPQRLSEVEAREENRIPSGMEEFDRVLGGGLVPGGVVLIGGEPGIGKSTLLLQSLAEVGKSRKVLYVTGEESPQQIALRAKRLGVDASSVIIFPDTNLQRIESVIRS